MSHIHLTLHSLVAATLLSTFAIVAQSQDETFRPAGLQRIDITSTTCTGFHRTPSFQCTPITVPAYLAKANTGDRNALVIVSHGSAGLDKRHSDYAHELAGNGINALVLGHWAARRLSKIQLDYADAREKGGTSLSQAIDVLAATSVTSVDI